MTRLKNTHSQSGFSLLETIMSVAIAGLIMTTFFQTTSTNLNLSNRSTHKAISTIELHALINELGSKIPIRSGIQRGRTENGQVWQVDINTHRLTQFGLNTNNTQRLLKIDISLLAQDQTIPINTITVYRLKTI